MSGIREKITRLGPRRLFRAAMPVPASERGAAATPDLSSSLALRRLSPLLLLAAALVALAVLFAPGAQPASADHADDPIVLVSNVGQNTASNTHSTQSGFANFHATGFTTGSNPSGYTLTSIEVVIGAGATASQSATIRAELWSATTGGLPASKIMDLTVPASLAAGTVSFTAPGNATLTADTTYFFSLHSTGSVDLQLQQAASDDEDSSSRSDWSIADDCHYDVGRQSGNASAWIKGDCDPYKMTVKGTSPPPPSGVELAGSDLDTSDGEGHFDLAITEGGSGTFTIALTDDPGGDATVNLVKTHFNQSNIGTDGHVWDSSAATLSSDTLTFNASNYSDPQTVTVTGADDADTCNEQLVILVLSPSEVYDYVYVGEGSGDYNRDANGNYVYAGSGNGEYSYRAVGSYTPVGGTSNSVTGVYVTVADDDGSQCGGV